MAFQKFVLEGDATLGFFAREMDDRSVRMVPPSFEGGVNAPSLASIAGTESDPGHRLETIITRALDFPSEAEFDAMFEQTNALREQGLQTVEGKPDITRENVRLRITVEVLED